MRKYKRQIAKDRLAAIGVDRVNRRLKVDSEGVPIWRKVLADPKAHDAQAKGKKAKYLTKGRKKA